LALENRITRKTRTSLVKWAGIAQSVLGLAMDWTVRGLNPGVGEIFRTRSDWTWGPPHLLYKGYCVISGQGVR
jgi:hypothetical protein